MTRVLVVRLDSVGDVLICGPAVRAVAAGHDVERVTMLCSAAGAAAARLLPGVDDVLTWDCPWVVVDPPPVTQSRIDATVRTIRAGGFDRAIVLTSFHQSPLPVALMLRMAGIGDITAVSVDHPGALLDVRLIPGETFVEDRPEPERALAIAGAAGYTLPEGDDGSLRIVEPGPVPAGFGLTGGYIVVHPGASAPARRWPADRFVAAVRLLHERGHAVVVTGDRAERPLTAAVSQGGAIARDLGGALPLRALAAVLARASVLICGNTGPAHLAAAVGTPVVSLFSPVVPALKWAPYGVPTILLGDQDAACRGTRARECPIPGHPCLTHVRPEDVADACERLAAQAARLEGASA